MKKIRLGIAFLCALLAALALAPAAAAQDAGSGRTEPGTRRAAVTMISQADGFHAGYMNGDGQGLFQPEKPLTRGELAQMLCGITEDRPASAPEFRDVPGDAWYAGAVKTAAGLGLMTGDSAGFFRPGDPATRAECACALSQMLPDDAPLLDIFPDVWPGHWAYQAICRTTAQGLFQGDGQGRFRPGDSLRRCEAAAVFNRLLGRSPDLQALSARAGARVFSDVTPAHWAYGEIMEAAVTHQWVGGLNGGESWLPAEAEETPEAGTENPPAGGGNQTASAAGLPDGPRRIGGHLYWVVGGNFVRSCNMGGLYFDGNGWYTTGDEELDGLLNGIVDGLTDETMTRDEKLRVLFNYVQDNFTYLKRPLVSREQTGWEAEYALFFLKNGKGNCHSFSAAYALLCREIGLPAYTVVGSALNSPHSWVEIVLDGSVYMFDTQLGWRYLHDWEKTGYDFFKMSPSETPIEYTWS